MSKSYPAIDQERLSAVSGGDREFEKELMEAFLEDAQLRVSQITEALQRQDTEALRSAAHTLKGAARNVGAAAIANVVMKIEEAASENELPGSDLLGEMTGEIARLVDQVRSSGT